jgi:hypothetical protein
MEVSQKKLDDALEGITNAIITVANEVLEPEDAYMFLTELDLWFEALNRKAERDLSDA